MKKNIPGAREALPPRTPPPPAVCTILVPCHRRPPSRSAPFFCFALSSRAVRRFGTFAAGCWVGWCCCRGHCRWCRWCRRTQCGGGGVVDVVTWLMLPLFGCGCGAGIGHVMFGGRTPSAPVVQRLLLFVEHVISGLWVQSSLFAKIYWVLT